MICRPFITLKNGKVLYANKYGKKSFCFYVEEVRPRKTKDSSNDESFGETIK